MKPASFLVVLGASLIFPALAQTAATPPALELPPPTAPVTARAVAADSPVPALTSPAASAAPVAAPAPAARPVRRATRSAAPADPYADLPIHAPARAALRASDAWASNGAAVVSGGSEGRVVFVFGETMPTVVCAPLRMCVIELQPGERVMGAPHVGDPSRWSVAPGIVGEGAERTVNVIVKPNDAGLDTNLLIPTNRRMYRLRLVSDEKNYVSVISFQYPLDQRQAWDEALQQQQVEEDQVVSDLPSTSIESLDFDYGIRNVSGKPSWRPVRVFNDGSKTYIQLPDGATAQDVPVLVALSASGVDQLVNFRMRGPYFVVDRVLERAALLAGVGRKGERVEIERGCANRTAFGRCRN